MYKSIKFLLLPVIVNSTLYISAMQLDSNPSLIQYSIGSKAYPVKTVMGNIIEPNKFLVSASIGKEKTTNQTFSVNIGSLNSIEDCIIGYEYSKVLALANGEPITLKLLQELNDQNPGLINAVFANQETSQEQGALLKDSVFAYIPIFRNNEARYLAMASVILQNITPDNTQIFNETLACLDNTISSFFEEFSYQDAFMLTLCIFINQTDSIQEFNNGKTFTIDQMSWFYKNVRTLVKLVIKRRLCCLMRSDNTTDAIEYGLDCVTEDEFTERAFEFLSDDQIIVFAMCEARELLNAIKQIYLVPNFV